MYPRGTCSITAVFCRSAAIYDCLCDHHRCSGDSHILRSKARKEDGSVSTARGRTQLFTFPISPAMFWMTVSQTEHIGSASSRAELKGCTFPSATTLHEPVDRQNSKVTPPVRGRTQRLHIPHQVRDSLPKSLSASEADDSDPSRSSPATLSVAPSFLKPLAL